MASTRTNLPTLYREKKGFLQVISEEEAVVWLWARPSLLPWPRPVEWLFSPVTGNTRWPGDLWGVDAAGNLLIIENKKGFSYDPFEDFIPYHRPKRSEWSAGDLLTKWKRHHKAEIAFRDTFIERGKDTDGILPRSVHRAHIRRWPDMARIIDRHVRASSYRNRVKTFLTRREKCGTPPPHYCGLLVAVNDSTPRLSARGRRSLESLRRQVFSERVHLFLASARLADRRRTEVDIRFTTVALP